MSGLDVLRENIITIAVVVGALGYLWKNFKSGGDQLDDRVIARYKEINGDQEQQIKDLKAENQTLRADLAHTQGRLQTLESLVKFDKVPQAFMEAIEASNEAHHAHTLELVSDQIKSSMSLVASTLLDVSKDFRSALAETFPREHETGWDGVDRRAHERREET